MIFPTARIALLGILVVAAKAQVVLSTEDFNNTGPGCISAPSLSGGCNWASLWQPFRGPNQSSCPIPSFVAPACTAGYVSSSTRPGVPSQGNGPLVRDLLGAPPGEQWFCFIADFVCSFGGNGPCAQQTGWNVGMSSGGVAFLNVVDPNNCPQLITVATAGGFGAFRPLFVGRVDTSPTATTSIQVWINPCDLTNGVTGLGTPTLQHNSPLATTWTRVIFSKPLDSIRVAQGNASPGDKLMAVATGHTGQPNTPLASLTINGHGTTCTGPYFVTVPSGGTLTLNWQGPPLMPFALLAGTRQPQWFTLGCSGSVDISSTTTLLNGIQFPLFTTGATGTATQTFTIPPLPPGPLINLQGLILQPPTSPCPTFVTTAAFYVTI